MRLSHSLICFIALCVIFISGFNEERSTVSYEALDTITEPELRDHIFFLASDELQGREPGTEGYRAALAYASSQFRAAGLKPGISDSKGTASFYQSVPLVKQFYDSNSLITITSDAESNAYKPGTDFAVLSLGDNDSLSIDDARLVYVGYGISEADSGWDDYAGLDVENAYIVFQAGAPLEEGEPVLPENLHAKYQHPQRSLLPKYQTAMQKKVAGMIILPSETGIGMSWDQLITMMMRTRVALDGENLPGSPLGQISIPALMVSSEITEKLFTQSPYHPLKGEGTYSTFELSWLHADISVSQKTESFTSHNVVAILPGSDEELKHEYISIGAHLDHEGVLGGKIYNGADDNASGSVAVLEAAEALAMAPPRRSVLFVLYTAEEKGLLGSRYFVEHSPVAMQDIILNINLDMVGRETGDPAKGINVIGSSKRSSALRPIVVEANGAAAELKLAFSQDDQMTDRMFSRSDHFSFHQKGVPAVFFNSGFHSDYTRPTDDPEKIDFDKLRRVTRLCVAVTTLAGNRDERLPRDINP